MAIDRVSIMLEAISMTGGERLKIKMMISLDPNNQKYNGSTVTSFFFFLSISDPTKMYDQQKFLKRLLRIT